MKISNVSELFFIITSLHPLNYETSVLQMVSEGFLEGSFVK